MSYKILSPAWETNLSCPAKLVLISLADQANDEGYCWPSVQTLMKRTGLCERSIRGHLTDLENAGHLTRGFRNGHSTVYNVHPIAKDCTPAKNCIPAPHAPPPLHLMQDPPAPHAPITVIEPKEESKPLSNPDGFDEFWSAYPRKVGKGEAKKLWAKLKVNGRLPKVLSAIAAQKSTAQWKKDGGQFIPLPATWLRQGRWDDEVQQSTSSFNMFAGAI
jgi:hypothetical protein